MKSETAMIVRNFLDEVIERLREDDEEELACMAEIVSLQVRIKNVIDASKERVAC